MADDPYDMPAVTHSLALALVATSDAPIMLLDGTSTVVAASASFAHAFHIDPDQMEGLSLFALGSGEWDVPQLRSLLKATLSGAANIDAYEMDLRRDGENARRLVITAHMLEYGDPANVRLLLAVSDVTDARLAERLKDDLLREKAILFQELQHRVANSLQIIASVLMQSARRVSSEETRGHLREAHSRVMSVAALQHQLAASNVGEVELAAYLTELCESIAASMIHDRKILTLKVVADEATAPAEISVSLGLIVTELVINALKHAFPDNRGGHILVAYKVSDANWALSVSDDGVGMPTGLEPAKAGLGTSIVQALAKQLGARVEVIATHPGTSVRVAQTGILAANPHVVATEAV
ncbi:MAG: sensor histidine kinase [Phenylobacterium sp.]